MHCVFCNWIDNNKGVTLYSDDFVAIADKYPVTPGHHLIIHRHHKGNFFDLSKYDLAQFRELLHNLRHKLCSDDSSIVGFNIGANCGITAGQTVMHVHIHVIPRRENDCADPRGGVRGVISEKQNY
jgi:diadenosine tetraphosphate (Ap4A) HIT family hydrolase